jgi:GAF domain-containing protein
VLGALTVQDTQPDAFDQHTIAVLQTMADQVGVALDNAFLFAESQAALEASRRAYGELSRQAWAELISAHPEWGYAYVHKKVVPADGDWRPEMLRAVQTGHSVQGHNQEKLSLAVPLKVRNYVVGVLSFEKGRADTEWTAEDVELLETLADRLGQALESARLYRDSQHRAAREQLIGQVTARVRESLDLETVLKVAANEMRQALGLEEFIVSLAVDPTDDVSR